MITKATKATNVKIIDNIDSNVSFYMADNFGIKNKSEVTKLISEVTDIDNSTFKQFIETKRVTKVMVCGDTITLIYDHQIKVMKNSDFWKL
jgi:hypothetical protein